MRTFRALSSAVLAAVLTVGVGISAPGTAGAAVKPKRILEEQATKQVDIRAFRMKGKVTEPQADGITEPVPYVGKVRVQKKACGTCAWKVVKTVKTNNYGTYKTRAYAPRKGRWKWRVRIPGSRGYAATKGRAWSLFVTNTG